MIPQYRPIYTPGCAPELGVIVWFHTFPLLWSQCAMPGGKALFRRSASVPGWSLMVSTSPLTHTLQYDCSLSERHGVHNLNSGDCTQKNVNTGFQANSICARRVRERQPGNIIISDQGCERLTVTVQKAYSECHLGTKKSGLGSCLASFVPASGSARLS